jgi:leader peptidase (prepilin peptidase)/N-methyltransferase
VGDPPWLSTPVALITAAVFGTIWGSFFNVCVARVPRGESVVRPPSHCFSCGRTVKAGDNIPILSYVLLRGRCRFCGVHFSPRYLLVEALTGLLSALICWRFVLSEPALDLGVRAARYALYFGFAGVLVVLSFIDLDTKRLPDAITLPSIPLFFVAAFAAHDVPWIPRVIGAAVGYLLVRLIADGYYYLTGREGMGLGDGKLLAVIGAVLGWHAILFTIFLASFVGIVVSVPILLLQRRADARRPAPAPAVPPVPAGEADPPPEILPPVRRLEVPFGPFLSLSAIVYLLFRDGFWEWLVERMAG